MAGYLTEIRSSLGSCKVSVNGMSLVRGLEILTETPIDALGGSSVGMLICNLAPGDKYAKDTLRTLK